MNSTQKNQFLRNLLTDIDILEKMIESGKFENSKPTIGAEQELCIVDKYSNVVSENLEILKKLNNPQFTTELAKYNIEINTTPFTLTERCFSQMQDELEMLLEELRLTSGELKFYLGGILPTLRYFDLDIQNITPVKRYYELVKNILKFRGDEYELRIQGEDELLMKHNSVFIEAATTSFQIHLEVPQQNFARFYNIAQLIAGPLMSLSANSPIFLRKKLWHETRIALLRQSIDIFRTQNTIREANSRVTFGNRWIENGILDLFREDISLHRIIMTSENMPDSRVEYNEGKTPSLRALQQYNSTVYRWNRPVYGVHNGQPNLRIENRILPAGPTILDQIANAAFWYGLIYGIADDKSIQFGKKDECMPFSECKNNFLKSARNGLTAQFYWCDGKHISAVKLLRQLLPIAQSGLELLKINKDDINKYLSVIEKRIDTKQNGASWLINSIKTLKEDGVAEHEILPFLVQKSIENQEKNIPVSEWDSHLNFKSMKKPIQQIVIEECMNKDIFTVSPDDVLQLAADIIEWQKIRFIMVENEEGKLIGIVSSRNILKFFNKHLHHQEELPITIQEIMVQNPLTINANQKLSEALDIMKKYQVGCLPVLQNDKLVGIITEQTFLNVLSDFQE